MSPVHALGKLIDHRSDIFSIGVRLYETATGRLPYQGENTIETLQKILHDSPQPFARTNPAMPPEFERIIMKCLEKEATRRYQSIHEMLIDLRNLQVATGNEKVTTSLIVSAPKPGLWWIGMVALLILAIGGILYFQGKSKPIRSLAVLPFVNERTDVDLAYLSEGITDEIINN